MTSEDLRNDNTGGKVDEKNGRAIVEENVNNELSDAVDHGNSNGEAEEYEQIEDQDGPVIEKDSETEDSEGSDEQHEESEAGSYNSEDESSSSSDEDEDPPALKYSRLNQLPKTFFNKEPVSSMLINEACFAFGTSSGLLHVTDQDLKPIGTIRARKSPILSIHTDGTHIIAASMDGTVVISSIGDLHSTAAYDLKTPIYSAVLNRDYKETKSFIYGTKSGKVINSTTNWIGTRTEKLINEDSGPIVKMELMRNILIWMSDDGITFYDLRTDHIVTKLHRPNIDIPAELCWPRVCFPEHDVILVGWCDHVWLIKCDDGSATMESFKLSSAMSSFSRPVTEVRVVVESELDLKGGIIAGIGSLKGDLIVLTVNSPGRITEPPELRIINSVTHEETNTDEVVLKGFSQTRVNDIFLGQFIGARTRYFIACSTDGFIAQEFDLQGRFDWYIERSKYLSAWEMSEHLISKEARCDIGIKQVEAYLDEENWEQAASFLKQVLRILDSGPFALEKWEQWSWIFIHSGKISLLASILPTTGAIVLPKAIYNTCLEHLLDKDEENFFHYITSWNTSLYDAEDIEQRVEQRLEVQPDKSVLRRALSNLYLQTDQPVKAVPHFIHLKDQGTIKLLNKFHLLPKFTNEIPKIIRFTASEETLKEAPLDLLSERISPVLSLLVDQRHEVSPDRMIPLLNEDGLQTVTFLYLQRITSTDAIMAEFFETELMSLYSELAPHQLLAYLKKAQHYDIDVALEITSKKELYPELVYLLGKVGQTSKAMYLIVDKLNDPELAVEFARSHPDKKLWDIFLNQGIKKPNFIKTMLQYTGTLFEVDVLKLIPEGMEIDGLKDSLERIMKDNDLVTVIHKVILRIIENEGQSKAQELDDLRWRGKALQLEESGERVIVMANDEAKLLER
jgi:hypothetical protein